MPTDLMEATTGAKELLFPDRLQGKRMDVLETSLYDAEEVQVELGTDFPEHGRWLNVKVHGDDNVEWCICPGEMVDELQTLGINPGQTIKVTRCEKSGPRESDPYEVNVTVA